MTPRLYTIPISHYGERARWALDLSGVAYDERHHLQMFSWAVARRYGGGKTVPVLVTDDGVLADSADIVRWASDRGAALAVDDPEVAALSREYAGQFGVDSRRFAYSAFFAGGQRLQPYNAGRCPPVEAAILRAGFPVAMRFATAYLGVRSADVARAIDTVDRTFAAVATRLADGRAFLTGERFTAADLTFAAMAAPCVLPDRYGVTLPPPAELAPAQRMRVEGWRAHPAGVFALRLYAARPAPRGRMRHRLRVAPRPDDFPP